MPQNFGGLLTVTIFSTKIRKEQQGSDIFGAV
jgi:hypothetical protein